jgi:hypothetical protein
MEIEGLSFTVDCNSKGMVSGAAEAEKAMDSMGTKAQETAGKIGTASDQEAQKTEESSERTSKANEKKKASYADLALGLNQTVVAGFSLYSQFDDLEKKELQVERAAQNVEKATQSMKDAQDRYNTAVQKYGKDSPQAIDALQDYQLAQEDARLATESLEIKQGDLNQAQTTAYLTVIPSVISGLDGINRAWKTMKDMDLSTELGKVKGALGELGSDKAGTLASVGLGVGALAVAWGAFNTKSEDTRIALSLLAGGLVAAAAAQWIWNAATAFGIGLTGVGLALVAVAGSAAAIVYAASATYGSSTDASVAASNQAAIDQSVTNGQAQSTAVTAADGSTGTGGADTSSLSQQTETSGRANTTSKHLVFRASPPNYEPAITPSGEAIGFNEANAYIQWTSRPDNMVGAEIWDITHPDGTPYPKATVFNRETGEMVATYGEGGLALEEQLAIIGDTGPERVLNPAETVAYDAGAARGGARTIVNHFYVNGARDVDVVVEEIARKMADERGMNY